jgi:hypothetical protein
MGFVLNVQMYGDPFLTPPMKVEFTSGFPAILTMDQAVTPLTTFVIRRATHSISKAGYYLDLEICDLYTLNGALINETEDFNSWMVGAEHG